MFEYITIIIYNTWNLVAEMAPYLVFGFLAAGALFRLIRPESVQNFLGKPGLSTIIKACLVGIPLPLCSCSVIPVAASLREKGASQGATAAFISSTPQTGVDSILATYSLMGGLFTSVRLIVAFVSGIVTGWLIELFCNQPEQKKPESIQRVQQETKDFCNPLSNSQRPTLIESLQYGFVKLPAELATALIVGLIIAGLITTFLPSDSLSSSVGHGFYAFLLATVIGLPLYVCATASIPMAYALIGAGLSPGAALVFLIVGPATNATTVATIWKIIGKKATFLYVFSLIVISWLSGGLFDLSMNLQMLDVVHQHETKEIGLLQHISGMILMLILLNAIFVKRNQQKISQQSCCHQTSDSCCHDTTNRRNKTLHRNN